LGSDRNDEDVLTDISVDVDTSSIGHTANADVDDPSTVVAPPGGSPADAEPNTLEPQMSVRGLAPSSSRGDEEDDRDRTARNLEEIFELVAAEQRTSRSSHAAFGPLLTPSDAFGATTSPRIEGLLAGSGPPSASAVSAASLIFPTPSTLGPPSSRGDAADADSMEPTGKRPPERREAEAEAEAEDETLTDTGERVAAAALRSQLLRAIETEALASAGIPDAGDDATTARNARPARPAPAVSKDEDEEEYRGGGTARMVGPAAGRPHAPSPQSASFSQASGVPASLPSSTVAARPRQAAPLREMAIRPMASSETSASVVVERKGNARWMGLLFLLSFAAAAAGASYSKYRPAWLTGLIPWATRSAPSDPAAPSAAPSGAPSATPSAAHEVLVSSPDASVAEVASRSEDAGVGGTSANADAGAAAAPSASGSAGGRGRNRGRPPRR
jgi:hypothetical protein